ncbi:hypothetical protein SPHINGO8AM_130125 [Sphingomonas sp. 8AM]|nr:hypothetical protein SPHINGO8AM_130125 [Sphingomonas sp. 8AM]
MWKIKNSGQYAAVACIGRRLDDADMPARRMAARSPASHRARRSFPGTGLPDGCQPVARLACRRETIMAEAPYSPEPAKPRR